MAIYKGGHGLELWTCDCTWRSSQTAGDLHTLAQWVAVVDELLGASSGELLVDFSQALTGWEHALCQGTTLTFTCRRTEHHGTTVLTTPPHGHWSPRSSPVTTTQDWVSCPSTTMMTTYLVFCSCPSISWSKVCCRPWANDLTCSPSTTTASPQDDAASWASQGSWLGVRGCWLRLGR